MRPSDREWTFNVDQKDWLTTAADGFRINGGSVYLSAFAVTLPSGTTKDAWIADYNGPDSKGSPDPCGPHDKVTSLATTEVDGSPVTIWQDTVPTGSECGGTAAFVLVGDRLYVFSVWLGHEDALLEQFLAGVDLP